MMRNILTICVISLIIVEIGMAFAGPRSVHKVPKAWKNLPGGPPRPTAEHIKHCEIYPESCLTYITVKVTVSDTYWQKTIDRFGEFQGSVVTNGWLRINPNDKSYFLIACAPKAAVSSDGYRCEANAAFPIDQSFTISKVNGWYQSPESGYRDKHPIKFNNNNLTSGFLFSLFWEPHLKKSSLINLFPRPVMIEPHERHWMGPYGFNTVTGYWKDQGLLPQFIVTPAMMEKFVAQGYFKETFSFDKKDGEFEERETITIEIEFLEKVIEGKKRD